MDKEKQIRIWVKKTRQLIRESSDTKTKDYIVMMWLGYLNGLWMTNAITYKEYQTLYDEMQQFIAGMEAA